MLVQKEMGETHIDMSISDSERDSIELIYSPTKKPKCFVSKKKGCCCLGVTFSILLSTSVLLVLLGLIPVFMRLPPSNQIIHQTTEYQIKLDKHDWKHRNSMMEEWMNYFERKSSFFSLMESEETSTSRIQYYIHAKGADMCNMNHLIRVRNYTDGSQNGTQTIDIKANSPHQSKATKFRLWPAEEYEEQGITSQKVERDEHGCDFKYSRESRIYFDTPRTFNTCSDLSKLFPYAFDKTKKYQTSNQIEIGEDEEWFIREYSGYLDEDTKYKAAFTLNYDIGSNFDGNQPKKGEWSIRLYTLQDGISSHYNSKVVADIENAWNHLIAKYGNDC